MEFPRLFRLEKHNKGVVENYLKNGGLNFDNREDCLVRPLLNKEDRGIWVHDSNGSFFVKRLSELLINSRGYESSFAFDKKMEAKSATSGEKLSLDVGYQ